jgi:hypothetical protein
MEVSECTPLVRGHSCIRAVAGNIGLGAVAEQFEVYVEEQGTVLDASWSSANCRQLAFGLLAVSSNAMVGYLHIPNSPIYLR